MAGNLRSLAFLTSFSSWAAPSRRLYSEWTCRWTNSACCTAGRLLELDGGGGLFRDGVEHRVDAPEGSPPPRHPRHPPPRPPGEIRGRARPRGPRAPQRPPPAPPPA